MKIFHTGRRTTAGERVADALSKGYMKEVEKEMPGAVDVSVMEMQEMLENERLKEEEG